MDSSGWDAGPLLELRRRTLAQFQAAPATHTSASAPKYFAADRSSTDADRQAATSIHN